MGIGIVEDRRQWESESSRSSPMGSESSTMLRMGIIEIVKIVANGIVANGVANGIANGVANGLNGVAGCTNRRRKWRRQMHKSASRMGSGLNGVANRCREWVLRISDLKKRRRRRLHEIGDMILLLFLLGFVERITSVDLAVVAKAIDSGFIPISLNYLIYDNDTSKLEIIIGPPVLLKINFSRQTNNHRGFINHFMVRISFHSEITAEGRRITKLDQILLNGNNVPILVLGGSPDP
ncbi:hypothetical protein SO802_011522 [Lithocarpus litseifolius]|uniref:Uncharacterized protein n=1 Tax=Lithocarpus litseifolius TaxID=425828 RepID=A0AAW2D413_9ROSI